MESDLRLDNKSRMSREVPVRFREGLGVRFPRATRLVVLCRTAEEAEAALAAIRQWVEEAGLTLHPTKTRVVDSQAVSFAFLGYSFRSKLRFPRAKSHQKITDRIRDLTPRKSGHSLDTQIQQINRTLIGWFNYFRHCHWTTYREYDVLIRKRLRRMLLKRHRLNPRRRTRCERWPNAFFTAHGLYSLSEAHTRFVQSHVGNY